MSILMRGNRVGVQKLGKAENRNTGIIMPEVADSLGVIKYVGKDADSDLKVGTKVYYGNKRQQVRMAGADIEVMESDNIFAVVEDVKNDSETKSA